MINTYMYVNVKSCVNESCILLKCNGTESEPEIMQTCSRYDPKKPTSMHLCKGQLILALKYI